MSTIRRPIDLKDLEDIKAYVEYAEQNGNASRVYHLRQLINEVERLTVMLYECQNNDLQNIEDLEQFRSCNT
jgi:hypothetical protein